MVLPAGQGQLTSAYESATGNLASITGPGAQELTFAYDGSLALSEAWSGPISGTVSRVSMQKVNGGNAVDFIYDGDSLLTQAGMLTLARDAESGLLTGTTLDSIADTVNYTAFGEVAPLARGGSYSPLVD